MEPPYKASFSTSRGVSATFPPTQTPTRSQNQSQQASDLQSKSEDLSKFGSQDSPKTDRRKSRRSHHHGSDDPPISPKGEPASRHRTRPSPSPRSLDPSAFDGVKSYRHKHSKSRDLRFPNPMSHLASSASARGLLPTWSGGKDKDREGDDELLKPVTRETTQSRWGSESTTGLSDGRNGSLLDTPEQHERLAPIRRNEILSMDDLEKVRKRRKLGEEYLRSALTSIGTLATDVTHRLDYTYYNLLEKITALNSTISLFQELSDSASTLLNDFERETAGLDQDIRKQLNDLKGFEPQIQKADALEQRMKAGRQRVEELAKRLETVRHEIDSWEQRETEWQTRTSRRLRIFWGIVTSAMLVLVLALVIQNWPLFWSPHAGTSCLTMSNHSSPSVPPQSEVWDEVLDLGARSSGSDAGPARYPSNLADRRESLAKAGPTSTVRPGYDAAPAEPDPLPVLDEL
ncbi:Cgr1 [Penicillium cf. griseofulvum]|uniref:Cgr1 n=1 Tax=Penicillium cf. griseofulvum TaxID=2972120 RepID=A0A9W9J1V6_9EURO|nr:Cgr1 [Penicillium cf. griseofulvum]KAJ5429082.1 Cgr1 [Penicillium cf. griseofulvum]KAJ5437123.1 Cgr1 [Penicillium cf. griseofulvum]